ncbi:class I SAM-dependent methyltransferase [Hyphobacterium sp. HN65]|uniref:Class I SAM-dependent methyltransferase n=1 Tax=Hyphobacterium lacteum TaxID=3116575 RepID=A0ABU7LQH5_9PROT|nr:class I SAM-dependent methyltransferase [Hyphobacterium sp. HN65]MEE2526155.1 class I SAM-dependent methyltransferase [Hyphobacterium sp. HN65]
MHTKDQQGIRNYVEMNCSIDGLIGFLLPGFESCQPGSYMDVGCGFGFSLDIARRLTGAEVKGIEPAYYGRVGSEALGLPILAELLTGTPESQTEPGLRQRADMIFSSEVIEHISAPDTLLKSIRAFLNPGGMAVITTPRAEALFEDISASEKLAIVSPGAHVFLYSKEAFEAAMRRAGFPHVEIRLMGVTQIAYVSDQPFSLPECDTPAAASRYLEDAAADHPPDTMVGTGIWYRLFRQAVQSGQWEKADRLSSELTFAAAPVDLRYANYEGFLEHYRACEASLCYHNAMLRMNHRREFAEASGEFLSAFRFCREILRIATGSSVVEADLIWLSAFHGALAAQHGDLPANAAAIWSEVASAHETGELPCLPQPVAGRIATELAPDFQPSEELMGRLLA